jgi:hypothetical protein
MQMMNLIYQPEAKEVKMATGAKYNNLSHTLGTSYEDLFGIDHDDAAVLRCEVKTDDRGTFVVGYWTGEGTFNAGNEYNGLPIGSIVYDLTNHLTYHKSGATTFTAQN